MRPISNYMKLFGTIALCLLGLSAPADEPKTSKGDPILEAAAPKNLDDLRTIEKQVKTVLEKVLPCTVGVMVGEGAGSGVVVSKEGHVLTAGHVSGPAGRDVTIVFPDGKKVKGKTLGANHGIDSGMIKITKEGPWPFAEMGNSAELKKGHWCLAIGHPGGFQPGRTPPIRLGRVLRNNSSGITTDCTLVGGDSGGPLFDLQGKVIGIHSRIDGPITENIHVPVDTYRTTWDRLAKSDVWGDGGMGGGRPANAAFLGVYGEGGEGCRITKLVPGSPAEKAGLKENDVVTKFGDQKISDFQELAEQVMKKKPGDKVSVEVRRGEKTVTLELTLGKHGE